MGVTDSTVTVGMKMPALPSTRAGAVLFVLFSCFLISAPIWETYQDTAAKTLTALPASHADLPSEMPHRIGGGRVLLGFGSECGTFTEDSGADLAEVASSLSQLSTFELLDAASLADSSHCNHTHVVPATPFAEVVRV